MSQQLTQDQITEQLKDATLKQRKWLKFYLETGNGAEAARLAGYKCDNPESYTVIGSENLRKLNVPELLEGMGLTKKILLQNVAIGIARASKKIPKKIRKYITVDPTKAKFVINEKGKKVWLGEEEIIETEYVEVPDWDARHKYLQDALKMSKLLTNDSTTVNVDTDELNFIWGEGSGKQVVNIKTTPQPQVDKV